MGALEWTFGSPVSRGSFYFQSAELGGVEASLCYLASLVGSCCFSVYVKYDWSLTWRPSYYAKIFGFVREFRFVVGYFHIAYVTRVCGIFEVT